MIAGGYWRTICHGIRVVHHEDVVCHGTASANGRKGATVLVQNDGIRNAHDEEDDP